jgi:hypothetical protein
MKRILVGAVVAVALSLGNSLYSDDAAAQKFSYDFTKKADTKSGFTQEWVGVEEGGWAIGGNGASRSGSELDRLLVYKKGILSPKFTVSAAVVVDTADGAHFGGVAFNIQDAKNFYVFRINSGSGNGIYQVLKMVEGKWRELKTLQFDAIKSGVSYTLTVQAKEPGSFTVSIKNGDEVVMKPEDVKDATGSVYTGGNAGIYTGSTECSIKNLSIEGITTEK